MRAYPYGMGKRWVDRALVAAALLLVGVIAAGALSGISLGRHDGQTASTQPVTEPDTHVLTEVSDFTTPVVFPHDAEASLGKGQIEITLHGSPETELLKACKLSKLGLQVENGQRLVIAY